MLADATLWDQKNPFGFLAGTWLGRVTDWLHWVMTEWKSDRLWLIPPNFNNDLPIGWKRSSKACEPKKRKTFLQHWVRLKSPMPFLRPISGTKQQSCSCLLILEYFLPVTGNCTVCASWKYWGTVRYSVYYQDSTKLKVWPKVPALKPFLPVPYRL